MRGGREIEGFPGSMGRCRYSIQSRPSRTSRSLPKADEVCKAMIMRSCEHAMFRTRMTVQGDVAPGNKKETDSDGESKIAWRWSKGGVVVNGR